jgi:hypothetical protein
VFGEKKGGRCTGMAVILRWRWRWKWKCEVKGCVVCGGGSWDGKIDTRNGKGLA